MSEEVQHSKEVTGHEDVTALDLLKVLPPVTDNQGRCLKYILEYLLVNRYYPTQREVALAMGIQSNTAEMYLQPLEKKGYLEREPGRQRNIRLTQDALERLKLMGVNVQERLAAA